MLSFLLIFQIIDQKEVFEEALNETFKRNLSVRITQPIKSFIEIEPILLK